MMSSLITLREILKYQNIQDVSEQIGLSYFLHFFELKPTLNKQCDSPRAKLFVWIRSLSLLVLFYCLIVLGPLFNFENMLSLHLYILLQNTVCVFFSKYLYCQNHLCANLIDTFHSLRKVERSRIVIVSFYYKIDFKEIIQLQLDDKKASMTFLKRQLVRFVNIYGTVGSQTVSENLIKRQSLLSTTEDFEVKQNKKLLRKSIF